MDIGKWKILAVSLALVCSLAIPVLAYTIYRTPLYPLSAGIILRGPTMQLGFYKDGSCTQPITTIDFGEMVVSSSTVYLEKTIWIRNEGSSSTTVFWNSTLRSVTTAITEGWVRFMPMPPYPQLNATIVSPSAVLQTTYSINIQASPPVGTYNWTLTVWGETYVQTEPPDLDIRGASETKTKLTLLSLLLVSTMLGSSLSVVVAYQYVWKTELYKKTAGLRIRPLIEGDINADGKVDELDLRTFAAAYGSTPTEPNWNLSADINGNKIVEVRDLFVIGANYGKP